MSERLKDRNHVAYHQGLETLGLCFGATTTRATDQGAPDVIWSFAGDFHLAFEAKTEKGKDSKLSKSDLQEAKGHPEWVRANLCNDPEKAEVETIIISESSSLHQIALRLQEEFLLRATKVVAMVSKNCGGLAKITRQI